MSSTNVLGTVDYTVIGIYLLISTAIGIMFRTPKNKTADVYILGGRKMSMFPVIMSITVTMLSAINMIGSPSEVFRFGGQILVQCFTGMWIGIVAATYVFVPVFFQCEISSVYEFLELRYGKTTKFLVSSLFLLQMVFFMSAALYAPALALDAVTNMSLEMSIIVFGVVCTLYSSVGGLKGVLWTDVFQFFLIFFCLLAVYIQGVGEAGGVVEIYNKALNSGRLNVFDFTLDFTTRYTFLNVLMRGFLAIVAIFGTSQLEVQRMLSMRNLTQARKAILLSLIPQVTLLSMCICLGFVMYAIFYDCDPVSDKEHSTIRSYDQIIPFYIVSRFSRYPGVTGLCVAGLFSGSLSTVSSILNSLSTVTLVDFIRPFCKKMDLKLPESRAVLIAKGLSFTYGLICIGFAFTLRTTNSIAAVSTTLMSIVEGPVFAVFFVGVLCRKGTEKCVLFAVALAVTFTGWIAFGSLYSGYRYPTLPLSTEGCSSSSNTTFTTMMTSSLAPTSDPQKNILSWYKISFQWYTTIGFTLTLIFIFLGILVTGWKHNVIPADSKCLSPVTRFWIKKEKSEKDSIENTTKF